MLNVSKTKELIVEFRRTLQHQRTYTPLGINGTAASGTWECTCHSPQDAEDMIWTTHIDTLVRKVKQCSTTSGSRGGVPSLPKDPSDLLCWCGGEHPDREHHCLVQQQLLSGQEGSAEGIVFS